jgi:hypothetical protein
MTKRSFGGSLVAGLLLSTTGVLAQISTGSTGPGITMGAPLGLGMVDRDVKGLPFSLVEKTTTIKTLGDGTTMTQVTEAHRMRDADGRTRTETGRVEDGQFLANFVIILDPIARTNTILNVREKTARVTHMAEPRAHGRVERTPEEETRLAEMREKAQAERADILHRPEKPTVEKLSSQNIAGVFAEGTRTTRVVAEGAEGNDRPITVVTEVWMSPELKILVEKTTDDPRYGKTSAEVTQLERRDPEEALFQVPADYKVIESQTPSSMDVGIDSPQ